MDSLSEHRHLVNAAAAFAVVTATYGTYCWLQLRAKMKTNSQLRNIIASAVATVTAALVFLCSSVILESVEKPWHAGVLALCCSGTCVFSSCAFVIFQVLLQTRHSNLGPYVFWGVLAAQPLVIGLGIWQLAEFQREFVCGIPVTTFVGITVVAGYALIYPGEKRPILLWVWFFTGLFSSGVGIVAALTQYAPPIECSLSGMLLLIKGFRDDRCAKDRMEGLPQDEPSDALVTSPDAHRPSHCDLRSSFVTSFQPIHPGRDCAIELLPSPPGLMRPDLEVRIPPSISTPSHPTASSPRPNSGVNLISPPATGSSDVSSSSPTTACPEAPRRYVVGAMQFPASGFSIFRVDDQMSKGYAAMDAFYAQIGNMLIPEAVHPPKSVLDVGAGTGNWALDVKDACPEAQVSCIDLLPTLLPPYTEVTSYHMDANESHWGWHDQLDYIHFRDMDGGIRNWETTFRAAFRCQRAEGFINFEQLVFCQPPASPTPDSIWHVLQRTLDCLKVQRGLAFMLQDAQEVQKKLESSGYQVISNNTRSFHINSGMYRYDGCDLLRAIIELVKGVLVRGWELQPEVGNKEALLDLLEMEFGRGLPVKVITIIAQKRD